MQRAGTKSNLHQNYSVIGPKNSKVGHSIFSSLGSDQIKETKQKAVDFPYKSPN